MDARTLASPEAWVANAQAAARLFLDHATRIAGAHGARQSAIGAEIAGAAGRILLGGMASAEAWQAYQTDAWQRGLIFLDVLRQRGNAFRAHNESGMPPVLDFAYEPIVDGRTLARPVNYSLVAVTPPPGVAIDPRKRPFMIVDPRAGHGAGIGGSKPESQVGEAFREGHAVYFVTFRPWPEPDQTLADVRDAEIAFLDEIRRRHPHAARPVLIGNCQGGWGCMLLAASAPAKAGPLAINGAPMSYWAGRNGHNPMRYLGGMAGGVAPALLMADLGNGVFDGSLLVQNFEALNPANSHWRKLYDLYASVDTEAARFLEFERWWGGFFMMTEAEIRWIVENLFIGNRLAHGQAFLGTDRIDLQRIRSPILVFASHGDNITPPQQALNWIADTYRDVSDIKSHGQRIVYLLHDTIGHLGIFVSAKVAGREHDAITDTMRAIEALPPGLYEMQLEQGPKRLHIKFAPRTIDDVLGLDDGRDEEEMFAAVAKLSELGARAYETLARPFVRAMVDETSARRFFDLRPLRLERIAFSDANPLVAPVAGLAENARATRRIVAPDNPFLVVERLWAAQVELGWNLLRDWRDAVQETMFHAIYGSPLMRMIGAEGLAARERQAADNLHSLPEVREALASIETGGEAAGIVRMLDLLGQASGYVRRSRLERALDLYMSEEPFRSMDESERARMIHAQALIVQFAPDRAKESLPHLLDTPDRRARALAFVMHVAGPEETMHAEALALFRTFERMLAPSAPRADSPAAA